MFRSYEEARNYIREVSARGSVLGLENMRALMETLGNPQNEIKVVHIAGTNGKGSVGAYLASVLKEAGQRVGRYCSPAVFHELECWQYDGRMITKEEYVTTLSQVKSACDIVAKKEIYPTVFEIETAMAFVYFKEMQVDVLLLETGMGGATDATNVVEHPLACVFTTISRDHMQFLGESLSEIAEVKAGIIKKGAAIFSASQEPEVKAVLDAKSDESITYVQKDEIHFISQKPGELRFQYKGNTYATSCAGMYQTQNIGLALEIFDHLFFPEEEKSRIMEKGIANTFWPGRFEVIGEEPLFIIDGAHNEDAVKQLAETARNCFTNQPIDFIIGILADKEHEKMLELMLPLAKRVFTVTPPNARGLDGRILAEEVKSMHEDVIFCETIEDAVLKAIAHGKEANCPILAFGSLSYLGQLKENYKQICESRMKDV